MCSPLLFCNASWHIAWQSGCSLHFELVALIYSDSFILCNEVESCTTERRRWKKAEIKSLPTSFNALMVIWVWKKLHKNGHRIFLLWKNTHIFYSTSSSILYEKWAWWEYGRSENKGKVSSFHSFITYLPSEFFHKIRCNLSLDENLNLYKSFAASWHCWQS